MGCGSRRCSSLSLQVDKHKRSGTGKGAICEGYGRDLLLLRLQLCVGSGCSRCSRLSLEMHRHVHSGRGKAAVSEWHGRELLPLCLQLGMRGGCSRCSNLALSDERCHITHRGDGTGKSAGSRSVVQAVLRALSGDAAHTAVACACSVHLLNGQQAVWSRSQPQTSCPLYSQTKLITTLPTHPCTTLPTHLLYCLMQLADANLALSQLPALE